MRGNVDLETRLEDLLALTSATHAEELHRALVLSPPAAFERELTVPLNCFLAVHDHDPTGAVQTAVLLVTDQRWVPAAGPLMREIEATGLVADDELDLLARTFVAAGPRVYWACPDDWFDGSAEIVLDASAPPTDDDMSEPVGDETETVVARTVPGAARRWAAARLVRREPSTWPSLLTRAKEAGGTSGAAIILGVFDAAEALPEKAIEMVRTLGFSWGRAEVRLAALHDLALVDPDAALARAAKDPAEKVRRWAAEIGDLPASPSEQEEEEPERPAPAAAPRAERRRPPQESLF